MLPSVEALLAGYALYARQNRFPPECDEARLAEATALADDAAPRDGRLG